MLEQVLQHLNNWFLVPAALRCPSCKQGSISGWWGLSLMMASTNTRQRT